MKSPIRIQVEYTFSPAQTLNVRAGSIRVPLRGPFKPAVVLPPCNAFAPLPSSQYPQRATLSVPMENYRDGHASYTWPGVAHFFSGQREKLETGLTAWRHFCKGLLKGSPHD